MVRNFSKYKIIMSKLDKIDCGVLELNTTEMTLIDGGKNGDLMKDVGRAWGHFCNFLDYLDRCVTGYADPGL